MGDQWWEPANRSRGKIIFLAANLVSFDLSDSVDYGIPHKDFLHQAPKSVAHGYFDAHVDYGTYILTLPIRGVSISASFLPVYDPYP